MSYHHPIPLCGGAARAAPILWKHVPDHLPSILHSLVTTFYSLHYESNHRFYDEIIQYLVFWWFHFIWYLLDSTMLLQKIKFHCSLWLNSCLPYIYTTFLKLFKSTQVSLGTWVAISRIFWIVLQSLWQCRSQHTDFISTRMYSRRVVMSYDRLYFL